MFRVSGRNAAPALQMREHVPCRVPGPAGLPVGIAPLPAAFLRENDRFHTLFFSPGENPVRVAAPVRQKSFRRKSVNRSDCPRAIRCRAPCDKALTGMPCASAVRCAISCWAPLRGSCPDCLLSRPPHVDVERPGERRDFFLDFF